jgi:signal peptidase I
MILMTTPKNNSSVDNRKRLYPEYKFLILVSAALALAFICSFFFLRLSRVDGDSMSPTLSNGDWILVSPNAYKNAVPERGDIIVFKRSSLTKGHIIKRVIGLPGETVEIKSGRVFINGSAIDDEFYVFDPDSNFGPIVVDEGSCFVLGDNRSHSSDSRHWEDPQVSFREIFGKPIFYFK